MHDLPITLIPLPKHELNIFTVHVSADMNDGDYTECTCIYTIDEFKDVIPALKLIQNGSIHYRDHIASVEDETTRDYLYELIPSDSEGDSHSPEILSITYVNDVGITFNVELN